MIVDKSNFHSKTDALFAYRSNSLDELQQIYGTPQHKSESGSLYWYLEEGVIRWSDHWGKVKDCRWKMSKAMKYTCTTGELTDRFIGGFCLFEDFTVAG